MPLGNNAARTPSHLAALNQAHPGELAHGLEQHRQVLTRLNGAGVRIRFQGVFGDSRCPADALCIQGGDALVRIDVLPQSAGASTYDLHTGTLRPVRHGDLTIALETLMPYPFSSQTISPGDYRATLRVTR